MLDKLWTYIKFGSIYCGIEVTSHNEASTFYVTQAKREKGEYTNLAFNKLDNSSELKTVLKKHQHCKLIVTTDKVLTKEISYEESPLKLIGKAFPGVDIHDFYCEILRTETNCFISICRKDVVHNIIKELEEQAIQVIEFHLGFNVLNHVLGLISENEILTSNYLLEIQNKEISGFNKSDDNPRIYKLGDENVSSEYLLGLAGALSNNISNEKSLISNYSEFQAELGSNFNELMFFRRGIVVALTLLLVTVFTNLFFFNSYYDQHEQLQQEVMISGNQKQLFSDKGKRVEEKQTIVDNLMANGNSKSSFYINKVIDIKPASILLTGTTYQPLERSIRPNKSIDYQHNELVVSGTSAVKDDFSAWLEELEATNWIKGVTVVSFGTGEQNKDGFEIKISLDDVATN